MLFYKKGQPVNPNSWSYKSLQLGTHFVGRVGMAMFGCPWGSINEKKIKVDYSEYLGPDWKPSFKNAGTIISNHTVFIDILVMSHRGTNSMVSKAGVERMPLMGVIGNAVGNLWI